MRIAITGTPGTGKSTVSKILAKRLKGLQIIDIYRYAKARKMLLGYDKARKTWIVDTRRLAAAIKKIKGDGDVIIVGHLSHLLSVDRVIVLRARPDVLTKRLRRKRWAAAKVAENVEAEILDVITQEAVAEHGLRRVFEIDTTKRTPASVVATILKILKGKEMKKYGPGKIDWTSYLEKV